MKINEFKEEIVDKYHEKFANLLTIKNWIESHIEGSFCCTGLYSLEPILKVIWNKKAEECIEQYFEELMQPPLLGLLKKMRDERKGTKGKPNE